jgi:hypothetical protein
MTTLARVLGGALILASAWVVFAVAGLSGAVYVLLFALATVPGLPLGFAMFGRHHAAGWIAGTLLGYALTALTCWAIVFLGVASLPAFILGWGALGAFTWIGITRIRDRSAQPLVDLPAWSREGTAALLLVLLLVPALVGPPFSKIGAIDAEGNRLYRAYFTADFVWHTALVAEMTKHTQPPRNPYLASEPVHYYWTYFLVPATIASLTHRNVEQALELNAFCAALLFISAIYLAAWAAVPAHPFAVALAVALTTVAASAEGLAAIVDLIRRGQSLAVLRELNIDAISSWAFKGLRIDNLPRAMWYTPQHAMACALGLLAVPVAIWAGVRARPGAIALAGAALAASVTFNPLLGAAFSAIYGIAILLDATRQGAGRRGIGHHAIAAALALAAVGWCFLNQMTDGAGSALHIGFVNPARNAPLVTFLLSFGPILLPAVVGLWPNSSSFLSRARPAIAGVALSILLMFFVTLTVDIFWVGFRAGNLFSVFVPALVARGFVALGSPRWKPVGIGLALLTLVLGLPTTIIDAYNTQDVGNRLMSVGGFHWTIALTPAQQEGLAWIRTQTAADAVVQAEPVIRERETWTLIPSFAERRMAAGLPISLMHVPAYDEKSEQVRRIHASMDADAAWRIAKELRIDYLYVDGTERAAYPAVSKFDAHPEYFTPVFTNAEVGVYRIR